MAKARRRKRFRKGSVQYKISAGNREIPVKYLNRVKLNGDTVLMFRLLRSPKKKKRKKKS